jgi:hypothetical protein
MPEDLEAIRLFLRVEQDRQRATRERLRIEATAALAISDYWNWHASRLARGHQAWSLDQAFIEEDLAIIADRERCHNTAPGRSATQPLSPTQSREGRANDGPRHFGTPFKNIVASASLFRTVTPYVDAVTHTISLAEKAIIQ